MKAFVVCLALAGGPAWSETVLPAFHDVTGVSAQDVLNLRAEPNASAVIVGSLPPGLSGVEVTALSADAKWGRINQSEASGWAAMRFLKPQDGAAWYKLDRGLRCFGTEPFWTLFIDTGSNASGAGVAHFVTPEEEGPQMDIAAAWPGDDWRPVAAVQLFGTSGSSLAVIRGETCSDGMSDASFGLAVDVFSQGETAASASSLRGCCTLAP